MPIKNDALGSQTKVTKPKSKQWSREEMLS